VAPAGIPERDPDPPSNIGVPKSSPATLEMVRVPPEVSVIVSVFDPEEAEIDAPVREAAELISVASWAAEAAGNPKGLISAVFGETVKLIELPSVIENSSVAEGYEPVPPAEGLRYAIRSGAYAKGREVVKDAFPPPAVLMLAVTSVCDVNKLILSLIWDIDIAVAPVAEIGITSTEFIIRLYEVSSNIGLSYVPVTNEGTAFVI